MSISMIEDWYSILSPEFFARAYKESYGELAWLKTDALRVLDMLEEKGYRVLGVDPWLPTRPGPTPLIRDWDESSPISAKEFVKTFELMPSERSDPELEPYFNFTVA